MFLQGATFRRIFTAYAVGLFQKSSHGRRLWVNLHGIPTLLQKISTVVIPSVVILERDVFDVVAGQRFGTGREIVVGIFHQQRMSIDEDVHQH